MPSSKTTGEVVLFSHMAVKPLTPEQLFDSLSTLLGKVEQRPAGNVKGGGKGPALTGRAAFVAFFQGDEGGDPDFGSTRPASRRSCRADERAPDEHRRPASSLRVSKSDRPAAQNIEQLLPDLAGTSSDQHGESTADCLSAEVQRHPQGLRRHRLGLVELQRVFLNH